MKSYKTKYFQKDKALFELQENQLIKKITAQFKRSPRQINQTFESDAELIRLEEDKVLAISLDNIVEEIDAGLYNDSYFIGWMTVMVNMSDLAAVGAKPIGMLLSQQIPRDFPETKLLEMQKGIKDACRECGTFILGGDTNESKTLESGGAAIGLIEGKKIITRKGCQSGDILFASTKMGQGSAFAFQKLFQPESLVVPFQPKSRLKHGEIVRSFATSCIDTSDGFFAALCNLMEVNEKGFFLDGPIQNTVHQDVLNIAKKTTLPPWIFLAGPHGEFELVFTIPKEKIDLFLEKAKFISWQPVKIGEVINDFKVVLQSKEKSVEINVFKIANLFGECHSNVELYLKSLVKLNQLWQLN